MGAGLGSRGGVKAGSVGVAAMAEYMSSVIVDGAATRVMEPSMVPADDAVVPVASWRAETVFGWRLSICSSEVRVPGRRTPGLPIE